VAKELKDRDISAVFEVIIPDFDPHIIKYETANIVLLDLVRNNLTKFIRLDKDERDSFCAQYNFTNKTLHATLNSWEEFKEWHTKITDPEFAIGSQHVEGFVIEDANQFMVKLKLSYYRMWKQARTFKDNIARGRRVRSKDVPKALKEFISWLHTLPKNELKADIITLRGKLCYIISLNGKVASNL
jgi:tRNA splicing ligase